MFESLKLPSGIDEVSCYKCSNIKFIFGIGGIRVRVKCLCKGAGS